MDHDAAELVVLVLWMPFLLLVIYEIETSSIICFYAINTHSRARGIEYSRRLRDLEITKHF